MKLLTLLLLIELASKRCWGFYLSTRVIKTNDGDLRGLTVKPNNRALSDVEVFLGVPYAAPPLGPLRFMPPMTAVQWGGVRRADTMPPVCPQKLPDVSNRRESLKRMPIGRFNYLQRLIPQLRNQSENCLYLNIYAPIRENYRGQSNKLPVMVYIHGESYEWNSGNAYDGTVLASYGQVVVVTLNFRLGILGFLRPALSEKYVSNFGLLDQIAALHWIKGNIGAFGGDPESVTIFGHGTGAALANLLLISPVAQASKGLFHRAILMSGSALSKWAFTWDPYKYTIQVAKYLKCPLIDRGEDLVNCLRSKTVEELLAVPLQTPPFTTPLGPIIDGTVIKKDQSRLLAIDSQALSKYDLLLGVTSAESFNILSASEVKYGMSKERRNRLLRAYISNTFEHQTTMIYKAVTNEYITVYNPTTQSLPGKKKEMELRDRILEILSDAQIVAPVVNMGNLHSELNRRSYFYVFNHQSLYGDYPFNQGTVHGEELAYVFGAPLTGGFSHFSLNYTLEEEFLSELVMTLWTNFAKTGNPNLPTPQKYKTEGATFDWLENLKRLWPAYDTMSQQYLHIDMQVVVKSYYRAKKLAVWNRMIPDLLSSSEFIGPPAMPPRGTSTIDLVPTFHPPFQVPLNTYATPMTYPYKPVTVPTESPESYYPKYSKPSTNWKTSSEEGDPSSEVAAPFPINAGVPLSMVVLIAISIIILHCLAMAVIYYKRDLIRFRTGRRSSETKREDSVSDQVSVTLPSSVRQSSTSLSSQKEIKDKKLKPKNRSNSEGYIAQEILLDSLPSGSASKESTLKKKHSTSVSSTLSRDGKSSSNKDLKSSKPSKSTDTERRRNKSDTSIYAEVNSEEPPDVIYRKNSAVKFRSGGSLQPKAMNKSSTSIASIKSTSSRSSVKSTTSRNSVKSSSSEKPVKKNASCQSLPTPEYCWGITSEITMDRHDPDGTDEKTVLDSHNSTTAPPKKNYTKLHSDVPQVVEIRSTTLPKARPALPVRSTSLTKREIEELEDLHATYRKKRLFKCDASNGSSDKNMESFYGTGGGEAPASPNAIYGTAPLSTMAVRRSRRSDGFEYGQSSIYDQYQPHNRCVPKEEQNSSQSANDSASDNVKSYSSYKESGSVRGPIASFRKSKENLQDQISSKPLEMNSDKYNYAPSISNITPTAVNNPSSLGSLTDKPSGHHNASSSEDRYSRSHSEVDYQVGHYEEYENTGTIKRRKSSSKSTSLGGHQSPDKPIDKPLKSVLKQTSAYDKPKPSTSTSSLSSSASINLIPVHNPISGCYNVREMDESSSRNNTQKKGAKIIAPSSRLK